MNNIIQLKKYLNSAVDQYRILHSYKKEIRYVKLFEDIDIAYITNEFYTVFVELKGAKFQLKSTNIDFIIKVIKDWTLQHNPLDIFNFYNINEYPKRCTDKDKHIFDTFDFHKYKIWLDNLSKNVSENGPQTFQYYATAEKIQLIFNNNTITQYVAHSQMLHYDTSNSCFLIRDTDIYIDNQSSETCYNVLDINNDFLFENDFNVKINKNIFSDLISSILIDFRGENILYSNSFIKENNFNTPWINKNIDLWVEPMLIFDANGNPCKKIQLIKKGNIVSAINSTLSSIILNSNTPIFDSLYEENFGNYNKIRCILKSTNSNINSVLDIEKIIDTQTTIDNNKLKINALAKISYKSHSKIITISFYVEDLFNVIKENGEYYYFPNKVFIKK